MGISTQLIPRRECGTGPTNANGRRQVTFSVPFPSTSYAIKLSCNQNAIHVYRRDKQVTGFLIRTKDDAGIAVGGVEVDWSAELIV